MANAQHSGMKHSRQRSMRDLLGASVLGVLLIIAVPALAETDAERIKDMERKIEALQNEVSQITSGMSHHSGYDDGLPLHGFMDVGFALNSQGNPAANPKGFYVGSLSFYLSPDFVDNIKSIF